MKKHIFTTASVSKRHDRQTNEDFFNYAILNHIGCWVVADGLGGHRGGEVASKLAVENIIDSFKKHQEISQEAIRRYLEIAQNAIVALQKKSSLLSEMRTTIVLLIADDHSVVWGHAGDTRLYHFRSGKIIFQTKDHSVPQTLANAGDIRPEQIRFHEDRNRLLRAMGQEDNFRPTILTEKIAIQNGDAFLLCTDGFWELVLEKEMELDFQNSYDPKSWLDKMEIRILAHAARNHNIQHDNYTAISIFINSEGK